MEPWHPHLTGEQKRCRASSWCFSRIRRAVRRKTGGRRAPSPRRAGGDWRTVKSDVCTGPMRFLMLALVACGGGATTTTTTPTHAKASDPACPVAVSGTSVTVEDTDTGAALVF